MAHITDRIMMDFKSRQVAGARRRKPGSPADPNLRVTVKKSRRILGPLLTVTKVLQAGPSHRDRGSA